MNDCFCVMIIISILFIKQNLIKNKAETDKCIAVDRKVLENLISLKFYF
jgi:hypothetical protein